MATRYPLTVSIIIVGFAGVAVAESLAETGNQAKPRVVVTTDINNGKGDPDDRQSLCHLLWYANELDIRVIVPDRFKPSAVDACNMAFGFYKEDYRDENTRFAEFGYPDPDSLRQRTLVTDRKLAIQRVIAEADASEEPLWVLVWGNMSFLRDVLKTKPAIADKLRVLTIGTYLKAKENGGDGRKRNWNGHGRQYVFDNFPNLWWVEADWTYNGMFPGTRADSA